MCVCVYVRHVEEEGAKRQIPMNWAPSWRSRAGGWCWPQMDPWFWGLW